MSLAGKRVLVTGAGGFIGSHVAEQLVTRGAHCRALVHYNALGRRGWLDHSPTAKEMEVIAGDITDTDIVDNAVKGCDVVLHLAALIPIPYSYHAPRSYVRTNVEGTLNVLQACRKHGIGRLVHTSTSEVYGTAQFVPITEAHPLSAQSPYAASKIGADQLVLSFFRSFGLPALILRPFNTYGPRQSLRAVIPAIILQALRGDTIRLGKTSTLRDFNFVQDTVGGFMAATSTPELAGVTLNLGSRTETSVEEVVLKVGRILGRKLRIESEDRRLRPEASEVDRLFADNALAKERMDWSPRVSLDGGLKITIEWFREHLAQIQSETFAL